MAYISWSSDFALYLWLFQIGRHHTLDSCSVWHCEWLHTICRSLWPIFHGPVTLPCISPPLTPWLWHAQQICKENVWYTERLTNIWPVCRQKHMFLRTKWLGIGQFDYLLLSVYLLFLFSLFSKLQNTYSRLLSLHFRVSNCILVIVNITTMFILYICLS